jgi:hypothetical protein
MHRWRAKRQTHGNHEDGAGQTAIFKGSHVLTNLDSPMVERMTFWLEATGEQLWLTGDEFSVNFERA